MIMEFLGLKTSIYHCTILYYFLHTNINKNLQCLCFFFPKKRTSINQICQYLTHICLIQWGSRYRQNLFLFRIELNVDYLILW